MFKFYLFLAIAFAESLAGATVVWLCGMFHDDKKRKNGKKKKNRLEYSDL